MGGYIYLIIWTVTLSDFAAAEKQGVAKKEIGVLLQRMCHLYAIDHNDLRL